MKDYNGGISSARDRLRESAQCEQTVIALNNLLNQTQKNAMLLAQDNDRLRAELAELRNQPAVPADAAKDADQNALRLALVWRVATGRETDEERAELGAMSPDATYGEFIAGIDAAILSATETEGRKDE